MDLRAFGRSGLQVPMLGFGAMQIGNPAIEEAQVERVLHHVLDSGLTLIDTARSYGLAEERIGRYLATRRGEFVLSTKVGYDIAGIPDWTYDCIIAGVEAALARLRTDVIDIVHLHSCGIDVLRAGDVTRALQRCVQQGKARIAAYSGDDAALRHAVDNGCFGSVQASVNVCDQQSLPVLQQAGLAGMGTIAKRALAGRPWCGSATGDFAHDEYRRRFSLMRSSVAGVEDWDDFSVRFSAFAPGVDCVIVGGANTAHIDRNIASVRRGPADAAVCSAVFEAFQAHGSQWRGLV